MLLHTHIHQFHPKASISLSFLQERQYNNTQSIPRFLSKLMELANRERAGRNRRAFVDPEVTSDVCHKCKITVEENCFKFAQYRWHVACLTCSKCDRVLRDSYRGTMIDQRTHAIYCSDCGRPRDNVTIGIEYVTQLEQYTFLLRVALRRLYSLLKVPGGCIQSERISFVRMCFVRTYLDSGPDLHLFLLCARYRGRELRWRRNNAGT